MQGDSNTIESWAESMNVSFCVSMFQYICVLCIRVHLVNVCMFESEHLCIRTVHIYASCICVHVFVRTYIYIKISCMYIHEFFFFVRVYLCVH